MDPVAILEQGRAILAPVLAPHGFRYEFAGSGKGSGGDYARGAFVRGDRRLEFGFRFSLGEVLYRLGDRVAAHEDLMRALLGRPGGAAYPGFSEDPLDGFRHLRLDLERHGAAFLTGADAELARLFDAADPAKRPRGMAALRIAEAG
jgi:hypothetical protein